MKPSVNPGIRKKLQRKIWHAMAACLPSSRWLAVLLPFCALHGMPTPAQVTCTVRWACPAGSTGIAGCEGVMGAMSGTGTPGSFASAQACQDAIAALNDGVNRSCNCGGAAAGTAPVTTGSPVGDALNLGANMWIIQNIKNPYGAVFAQNFTQGFLTGLFKNDTPEAQRQRQLALDAMQRQQQEQAERARIAEQQRINAIFGRLNRELKLSGDNTQLALKTDGQPDDLHLKLSDSSNGFGIKGLPGIYVGGPAQGPSDGGLKLKLDDESSSTTARGQGKPSMGIPGLPGLNLNNVQPEQAAQVANAATTMSGPERDLAEDAALQAAKKNPELTSPSDDPLVQDYQKLTKDYDGAVHENQAALEKASEAQGHVQTDQTALAFAKQQLDTSSPSDQMRQAYAQMETAAGSDEQVAAQARQMFEGTQIQLSVVRDRAAGALAGLAPPPANLNGSSLNSGTVPGSVSTPSATVSAPRPTVPLFSSNALPVLGPSAKPQLLATPVAPAGKPNVETLNACLARTSSKRPGSDAPTLEELQKQLEGNIVAMERLDKSAETSKELNEEWSKELHDAHVDIFNNETDALLDGLLGVSKKYLEMDKEAYHEALEESMSEAQRLRWEHQATAGFGTPNAIVEANLAAYPVKARALLEKREGIEGSLETVENLESSFGSFKDRRDLYLFLTDNAVAPCSFGGDKKIDCTQLMKYNGVKKLVAGDLVDRLDQLKQAIKIGVKFAEPVAEFTPGGAVALTTYQFASMGIDVIYDETAVYFSKQRLQQMKQDDAQLAKASAVLGARLERLHAEMGCYETANAGMSSSTR